MPISTYAGNLILDALLNQGSAQIATAYCSLHSGDPALTGANVLMGKLRFKIVAGYPE